jgi:hypothetical protein
VKSVAIAILLTLTVCCRGTPAEAVSESPFDNEPAHVSLYEAHRASPVITGKISDPAWKAVPKETRFYKFWDRPGNLATSPLISPIKTEMQVCYDDLGLTFALKCPTNMAKLTADHNERDDGSVWRDDCVELYLDPNNTGMGFLKFITNPNGIRCDIDVMDTQNWNYAWSPDNWKALTSRDDKAWYVELYFPWTDLGYKPKDGEIWTMNVSQFAFPSLGNATNWSVGADYETPSAYGYLYFGTDSEKALAKHSETISNTKGKRWMVYRAENILIYDGGRFTAVTYPEWGNSARAAAKNRLEEMKKALEACSDPLPDDLQKKLSVAEQQFKQAEARVSASPTNDDFIEVRSVFADAYSVFDDICYWAKLRTLLKSVAGKPAK